MSIREFSFINKKSHPNKHRTCKLYLEPQTTIYKWMFSETTIFYIKIWNHPIETTIYKWLLGVPGRTLFFTRKMKLKNETHDASGGGDGGGGKVPSKKWRPPKKHSSSTSLKVKESGSFFEQTGVRRHGSGG